MSGFLKRLLAVIVIPVLCILLPFVGVLALPWWIISGWGLNETLEWYMDNVVDNFMGWVTD